MVRCEKCGRIIAVINLRMFDNGGSDTLHAVPVHEMPDNAVIVDTTENWCGYGLDIEDQMSDIECPFCREFPFKHEEVQEEEVLRLVMFKSGKN